MTIDAIFEQIKSEPILIYSIVIALLTVVLIGYIKRWNWATDPTGNRKSIRLVELFGFEIYRKIMIVILVIGIICFLFLASIDYILKLWIALK